jgi:predicted transcriptional regulator
MPVHETSLTHPDTPGKGWYDFQASTPDRTTPSKDKSLDLTTVMRDLFGTSSIPATPKRLSSPVRDVPGVSVAIDDLTVAIKRNAEATERNNTLLAQNNDINDRLLRAIENGNRDNNVIKIIRKSRSNVGNEPEGKRRRFDKFATEQD